MGQFSRRFLLPCPCGHHVSLFHLSLFLPLSCLRWHPSSCPTTAPTYEHRLYKRARATTCFLLSPPLDRVQRVSLLFPQPFVQPTGVISHAVFPPLFSYVSLSPMRSTYIHLRLFLFLFPFLFLFFSFLSPVAHSCSSRRRGLDEDIWCVLTLVIKSNMYLF